MVRSLPVTGLWMILLAALAACGGAARPIGEVLGLATDRPTFVFFFTPG